MTDKHTSTCITDKYVIGKLICKGSFGRVYKATNLNNQNDVIIKIIKKNFDKTTNKIKRDIEIPKIAEHPNIVKIEDHVETELYVYIIYPYLENSICLSKIKSYQLIFDTPSKLYHMINIMCQICDAIEHLHLKNIVHRDIKPHNIIISNDVAILIDFDLASIIGSLDFPLRNGIIGTPNYMAPEIWKNEENIEYKLTDIYSFGVTLYYVFNKKKLPFDGNSMEELEYRIRNYPPIPSRSGNRSIDKLIMSMIKKDPHLRPSISNVRSVLHKIIQLCHIIELFQINTNINISSTSFSEQIICIHKRLIFTTHECGIIIFFM